MMNINRLCKVNVALLFMFTTIVSCSIGKHKRQENKTEAAPISFSKDTTATNFIIKPGINRKMTIENLQVYVSHNTQPGVGVSIKRAGDNKSNIILPHIANGNVYIFGGQINIILNNGDEAKIEVADIETGKLLNARIVISGTEQ